MKTSCEIIKDILPLYCDEVCSEETRKLVEEHIGDCPSCAALLEKLRTDCHIIDTQDQLKETDVFKKASEKWKKSIWRAFYKGAVAVATIVVLVIAGRYGFCEVNFIHATPELVDTISYEIEGDPNNIAVVLKTNDGYSNGTIVSEMDKDGNVYLSIVRPIIKEKNRDGDNLQILYTANIENMTAVYYGTPKDNKLLWDNNRDLPEITYKEIAKLHENTPIHE